MVTSPHKTAVCLVFEASRRILLTLKDSPDCAWPTKDNLSLVNLQSTGLGTVFFCFLLCWSSSLHVCSLQLQWAGLLFRCSAQASHCSGFSCCGLQAGDRAAFTSCGAGPQLPTARRTFWDQDSNLCPLHWLADSLPLDYCGCPWLGTLQYKW